MGFPMEQEDELWIRARRGESSRLIGRARRCHPSSVRASLARSDGVLDPVFTGAVEAKPRLLQRILHADGRYQEATGGQQR